MIDKWGHEAIKPCTAKNTITEKVVSLGDCWSCHFWSVADRERLQGFSGVFNSMEGESPLYLNSGLLTTGYQNLSVTFSHHALWISWSSKAAFKSYLTINIDLRFKISVCKSRVFDVRDKMDIINSPLSLEDKYSVVCTMEHETKSFYHNLFSDPAPLSQTQDSLRTWVDVPLYWLTSKHWDNCHFYSEKFAWSSTASW